VLITWRSVKGSGASFQINYDNIESFFCLSYLSVLASLPVSSAVYPYPVLIVSMLLISCINRRLSRICCFSVNSNVLGASSTVCLHDYVSQITTTLWNLWSYVLQS
jgi:hypothetical protein